MTNKIKIGLVVILVIISGGFLIIKNSSKIDTTQKDTYTSTENTISIQTTTPAQPETKNYTMAEVKMHSNAQSCWTAVNGNVYDVTAWINQHPGGKEAILSLCGKDGTKAFTDQHGGQRRPEQELKSFLIGVLK